MQHGIHQHQAGRGGKNWKLPLFSTELVKANDDDDYALRKKRKTEINLKKKSKPTNKNRRNRRKLRNND